MNALVYSCLVCRRSELPPLRQRPEGLTARCFSDEPRRCANRGWEVSALAVRKACPVLTARWHKILPHVHSPGHCCYVWVDAHIVPTARLSELLAGMDADLGVFRHRQRTDPYQELREVSRLGLEHPAACEFAARKLREDHYPQQGGLHETGILLMRNSPRLRRMLRDWWDCLEQGKGTRDQLHFDRVARKHGLAILELPGTVDRNPYFAWTSHDHPASVDTKRRQREWIGTTRRARS